jgi:hypothetical protein
MFKEYKDRWNSKLVNGPVTLRKPPTAWDKWDLALVAALFINGYIWLVVAGI